METTITPCFLLNVRYTGTDLPDSLITRTKTINAEGCQRRCQHRENCNFFLYFSPTHSQWFKRRECRLLRQRGTLQTHSEGHISGPKLCEHGKATNDSFTSNKQELQSEAFIDSSYENLVQKNNKLISKICIKDYHIPKGRPILPCTTF